MLLFDQSICRIKMDFWRITVYNIYLTVLMLFASSNAFSLSCAGNLSISDFYLFHQDNIIVSFYVTDSHTSTLVSENYMDIQITNEFNSNQIADPNIRIHGESAAIYSKGVEWVSVLLKQADSYSISLCTPKLTIEEGHIIGETGLAAIDNSDTPVTIEWFNMALSVFQQGLSLADDVCQSSTDYCANKVTYDRDSGILDLPSVEYLQFGFPVYTKAKLQKTGDNPMTFQVIEISN